MSEADQPQRHAAGGDDFGIVGEQPDELGCESKEGDAHRRHECGGDVEGEYGIAFCLSGVARTQSLANQRRRHGESPTWHEGYGFGVQGNLMGGEGGRAQGGDDADEREHAQAVDELVQ